MGSIPIYDLGDKIRIGNHAGNNSDGTARDAFKDAGGTTLDPTTVTLRVRKLPSGTARVYGWPNPAANGLLSRPAIGRFYVDLTHVAGENGRWAWRLEGTDTVETADEGEYSITPSAFF